MITTLAGRVAEKQSDFVVIECAGVGYGVQTSVHDESRLIFGQQAKLYIYENIKEDVYDLYGFREPSTKKLFELLLSVKNIGPKAALAVLNIGNADALRTAIAGGDVKFLQMAKGVGKRAAEQIVVELRDKVGVAVSSDAEHIVSRSGIDTSDEALQALVSLGYSEVDAQVALQGIEPSLAVEVRIKQALRGAH